MAQIIVISGLNLLLTLLPNQMRGTHPHKTRKPSNRKLTDPAAKPKETL